MDPTNPIPESPEILNQTGVSKTPNFKNSLVLIMSILLIITVAIAGLFYFQIQKLSKELSKYQSQPSPTPTATIDPTADWKTYTNTKYGYSIKYPNNYISGYENVLYGEFIESNGSEDQIDVFPFTEDIAQKYYPNELDNFLRILVFDTKIFNEFNRPLAELADSTYQQQKSHFETTYISSLTQSKFNGYNNYEYIFSGKGLFMLSGATSVKDGKYKVIFFQKDGNVYSLYLKNSGLFDQILSTFRFLGNNTSTNNGASCQYKGKTYNDGDAVPSDDKCNTCSCDNGEVACTLMFCQ